jgi:hypothetical protein
MQQIDSTFKKLEVDIQKGAVKPNTMTNINLFFECNDFSLY